MTKDRIHYTQVMARGGRGGGDDNHGKTGSATRKPDLGHLFTPEITREDGQFVIWLPQFETYGRGKTRKAAELDLEKAVTDFIEMYLSDEDFENSPNWGSRKPLVKLAKQAADKGVLLQLIFKEPARS